MGSVLVFVRVVGGGGEGWYGGGVGCGVENLYITQMCILHQTYFHFGRHSVFPAMSRCPSHCLCRTMVVKIIFLIAIG